ncbi:hypothetical protein CDAR_581101 [Caerostris darwini]|uniref:Uncharacterized protein n=1 Tax=Caerostris darwini TaxID=1538125 RepID=A0AAV4M7C8_9ARAC|nr:hypothetical protein CDAR_265371 [Caerostris darwini]GIY48442.1 hypothetical protein CDAR_581101 [Caerostris darwini]
MPILSIQNANNPMIPTSGINFIQPTQQLASFVSLSSDIPLEIRSFSMDTLCTNKESTLNRTETQNPKGFASHFSLPCTSQNSAENISFTSRATQTDQDNSLGEIKISNIESHTWEHSVTSSSENKNACKISNTIAASEVSVNCNKNSADKSF